MKIHPQFENTDFLAPSDSANRPATEKAAILLAALNNPLAIDLLKKLDPDQVKQILNSTASLGPLTSGDVEPLVEEFAAEFADALGITAGPEQLMRLLESAFSTEEVAQLLGKVAPPTTSFSWSRFTKGMETTLVPYLLDESEQTATFILTMLPPEMSARCLELLPTALRNEVASRMLTLRTVKKPIQEIVEKILQDDFFGAKVSVNDSERYEKLALVINKLDREQAYAIIEDLIKLNPESGSKVRKLIFMFEDIELLEPQHRAKLLDRVPTELIISALCGSPPAFIEIMLQSLSARTRRMIESELPAEGAPPRKDTVEARRRIAEIALKAAKDGDIELPKESSGETVTDPSLATAA